MPIEQYNVVFCGKIAEGHTVEEVKNKLIAMFKVPLELLEGAFEGSPLMVKEQVDYQTAIQYKTIFERAGTVCEIEAIKPSPEQEVEVLKQRDENEREQTATFYNNELEILKPEGWVVEAIGGDADIIIKDSQTSSYFLVLNKSKSDFRSSINYEQYSQLSRIHIKKHNQGYQEVSGPTNVDINGMQGVQYEITVSKDENRLHYVHTMLDGEETFFQLIGVAPISSYEAHKLIFENILKSFRIKGLITKDQELFDAVIAGDLNTVQQLIEQGLNVNARSEKGLTPLHYAANHGFLDIARVLIEQGADVNARENDKGTPLHYAAMEGFLEIARLLIDHGADIHATTTEDMTPLHTAAMGYDVVERENLAIGELLIEKGADINMADRIGLTPLELARLRGPTEFVRILREAGAT